MIGWLAHTDENKVEVLYSGSGDTDKQKVKEIAKFIRRGLIVREILTDDARYSWGKTISEKQMKQIAAQPVYDDDEGSATFLAEKVVAAAREAKA